MAEDQIRRWPQDKDQIRQSIEWRKENGIPQIPGDVEALNQDAKGDPMANEETHPIEDEDPAEEVEEADEDPSDEEEDPGDEDED